MRYLNWLILVAFISILSGCSMFDSTGATIGVINNTRSPFINLTPDARIEKVLTEHFFTSPVEWESGAWEKVVQARGAVSSIYSDLKKRRDATGTVPYYAVVYTTEFVALQWSDMKGHLNTHEVKTKTLEDGTIIPAVSVEASIIWGQLQEKIDALLLIQQRNLQALERTMDEKVSDTMLKQYNDLFSALEPIVNMVL